MFNNFITYGTYGKILAILIFIFGIQAFQFQTFNNNKGYNLIMILISQEIILFSISLLLVNISLGFDDFIGVNLSIFLLALAGCESSLGLALQIAYFPIRDLFIFFFNY